MRRGAVSTAASHRAAVGQARIRFSDEVEESDVVEASRLLWVTKYQTQGEDDKKA